ncbi:hypothetical protein BDV96DRAFT_246046 [Lophiotrema nucula]|uniref:Uncharacterized protein n=1 Tax=Lophiotrema nucula TaxID=690887 RepID=A0A6A5YS14_9PLEO|nr:hypothetical protein BDV96DRAFT_246046 [Lophiotrema nucula]
MGNTQSSAHPHQHHHKLSKPKTNTNSPSPIQNSPVSVSSKYVELSAKDRQYLKSQLISPIDTEFGSGYSYDGNDESIGKLASHVQMRLSNMSRSNSVASQKASKHGSTTKLTSLPGSKLSLDSNPQPVDLATAIKLLQEVSKTATPDDLAALHEALQTSPSPKPSQDVSRRASLLNRSTSSLIRRRSLVLAPGVATRNSPTAEKQRRTWNSWKTPQSDPHESKWRKDMMGTSPLTRIAALDLAEEGRDSPTPRAQTPGEMDYSHLGSLKLGSLVVTNGAPSPAPSARRVPRRQSGPRASSEEDYFTASEGSASPIQWTAHRMDKPKKGHSRSKSSGLPVTPPLHHELRISNDTRKAKAMSQCNSPLKLEVQTREIFDLDSDSETTSLRRLHVVNKSADTLARSYMAELPSSPFKQSDDSSPQHDEGFADADDEVAFRAEAFRILDGTIFGEPATARALELSKPVSQVTTSHEPTRRRKGKRPTPRKADSGYSSGGSFRAVHAAAVHDGTVSASSTERTSLTTDSRKSGNGSYGDDATSLYTFAEMLSLPVSKPLPSLPVDEEVENRLSLQVPRALSVQSEALVSPNSPHTPVSVASRVTVDSKASEQKRLQKRRPSCQSLPVVQTCQPVTEGSIPAVPDNVRAKFVRRLSQSPAMECLTKTYPSIDHETNIESVIDSPIALNIEFPSPSSSPAPRPRKHTRSQTERPPTPPPHGLRRSLSLFRSKTDAEKRQATKTRVEDPAFVMDLGTVAGALGSSPYDAAMPSRPKTPVVTSPTHPHQLGNALPRAKSMASMDAKTAAEVARFRSKDRALSRPEMPQRPKSYHEANLEAGEAMVWKRRPHNIYAEQPPVPNHQSDIQTVAAHPQPRVDAYLDPATSSEHAAIRAKPTGRGQVVSQLVNKYDRYDQKQEPQQERDWEAHARLWSQRRKSIGEGLRQRAEADALRTSASSRDLRASSQPPEKPVIDRYSGGLDYGYEGRGYGVGGSAGTRMLHSAASRKSLLFSNQYGVDLSDVPVILQRVQH